MKQPIALRIEADLLVEIRRCASEENRTLTNFIETVLKARVANYSRPLTGISAGKSKAPTTARPRQQTGAKR